MSDKELSDAEYDSLLASASQSPIESSNPDTSETSDDDDSDSVSQPYAQRYPAMRKLLEMQRELSETVLSRKTEAKDKAGCARAWKELEVLRRIILGKHVTVEPARAKEKRNASPLISIEPTPDQSQAA